MRGKLTRFGLAFFVGAAMACGVALYRGLSIETAAHLNARYLCDGFFVAGLVLSGIGGLTAIATTGVLDIMGYGFHSLLVLFTPFRSPKGHESFYEYKQEKEKRRRKPGYTLLIAGLTFFALSLVALTLYYRAMGG